MTESEWWQLQIEEQDRVQRYIEARLTTIQKRWGKDRRAITRRILKGIEEGKDIKELKRITSRMLNQRGLSRQVRDEVLDAADNMYRITAGMYDFIDINVAKSTNPYQQLAEQQLQQITRQTSVLTQQTVENINRQLVDRDLTRTSRKDLSRILQEAYDQPLSWASTQVRTGMRDLQDEYSINVGREAGTPWFKYVGASTPERPFCKAYLNYYIRPEDITRFQAERRSSPGSTYNCRHTPISVFEKPDGAPVYV